MAVGSDAKVGVDSYVALSKEGTFGTYASATTAVEAISCSFITEIESKKLDGIGYNRGFSHRVTLGKSVAGAIESYLHPQESVLMIAAALGGPLVSTVGNTTTVYSHSITAGNFNTTTAIKQLSFNVRKGDTHTWRYTGGRVNSMKLNAKVGEPIMLSAEFVFKDSTQQSDDISAILSISSVNPFTFANGVFRYATTEVLAATTTSVEPIQEFELSIKNNIKSDQSARSLGTITVDVLPVTRREVELKINNRFDTTTTYNRFIQATQGSVELFLQGAAIDASNFYEMTIRLPKVYAKTGDTEISGAQDVLTTEISYDVILDNPSTSTGKDIGITFKNNVTAY